MFDRVSYRRPERISQRIEWAGSMRDAQDAEWRCPRPRLAALWALFTALASSAAGGAAQEHPRTTVTGGLAIGLSHGTLNGDFCLTPTVITDTVTFVLNRSLAVLSLRGARLLPELTTEQPGGAAFRYRALREPPSTVASADPICVVYEGAETVYDISEKEYRPTDGSEVIAFNGKTVRARGYARWYPAIYDPVMDQTTESEVFRVTIRCDECRSIYVNGAPPLPGPEVTVDSDGRRELFLLAGDFEIREIEGWTVIGEGAPSDSIAAFLRNLIEIQRFQESYLGVPFGERRVLLRSDPVRAPRRGRLWGFYSDPTLSLVGMSISEFVSALEGRPPTARRSILGLMAHELGHRYFGWALGWLSPHREIFGEPLAVYLELKTVRHFLGEEVYRRSVESLANRVLRGDPPTPLSRSTPTTFAYDSYRYGYVPLQMLALESLIGEDRMRRLLRTMLEAPEEDRATADLDFMQRSAVRVGVTGEEWARWLGECAETPPRESSCIRALAGD